MKHRRHAILLLAALCLAGCGNVSGPLRIQPIKNEASFLRPNWNSRYYRADRDNNVTFVLQAKSKDASGGPSEEDAVITVFWTPRPGRTAILPSALNATFRFVVMTPTGVGMYEGAGFVRLHNDPGDGTMHGSIEDGDLRLTQATANFNDALGRARILGKFKARYSDSETVSRTLALQRDFFQRSLAAGGGNGPAATQPRAE